MTADEIRALFPATERLAYFATNGYGLLPTPSRDRMAAAAESLARSGYGAHAKLEAGIDDVRAKVASLLNADPAEVGFTGNTFDGLAFAAETLPLVAGDEVLLFADEYPSVVKPFVALERRGVKVRVERATDDNPTAAEVAAVLRPSTKCLALSWVRYDNGARADLDAIGAVLAGAGVHFVVDAIQGLGVFPIDVDSAQIDVLAAGTHKWMLGLAGLGVLFVRRSLCDLRDDASRVEGGAHNEVAIAVLGESLDVLGSIGRDDIVRQVRAVTDHLCAGFEAAGGRVRSPRDGDSWSSILALEPPPGVDADELCGRLLADRVVIGVRDGALWGGPHVYTSLADADRLLSHLV